MIFLISNKIRGQAKDLTVADQNNNMIESYKYDLTGNMLSKTINGKTTNFNYDKANQLVSSQLLAISPQQNKKNFKYDAAGRLIKRATNFIITDFLIRL